MLRGAIDQNGQTDNAHMTEHVPEIILPTSLGCQQPRLANSRRIKYDAELPPLPLSFVSPRAPAGAPAPAPVNEKKIVAKKLKLD